MKNGHENNDYMNVVTNTKVKQLKINYYYTILFTNN